MTQFLTQLKPKTLLHFGRNFLNGSTVESLAGMGSDFKVYHQDYLAIQL